MKISSKQKIKDLADENISLLMFIQRIREAAGDQNGRLMQDELIEYIKDLRLSRYPVRINIDNKARTPQEEVWAHRMINIFLLSSGSIEVFEKAARIAIESYLFDLYESGMSVKDISDREHIPYEKIKKLIRKRRKYVEAMRAEQGVYS